MPECQSGNRAARSHRQGAPEPTSRKIPPSLSETDDGHGLPAWGGAELPSLFDPATDMLDHRVLSDEALHQLEFEQVFPRERQDRIDAPSTWGHKRPAAH